MSDAVRRAARSFAQAFTLVLVTQLSADVVPDLNLLQEVVVSAGWAGVFAVLVWAHNAVEDRSGRSLGK